ncbi:hypothetical protein LSTR_LSTR000989 [Laodelphax striatellus]|uniref:C2H2-type domain-containing protein n=1 Tax=Laodelphax striatellus TaxID=195883 RepID=A0A482X1R4_LAOST|nr:hypothetical protein LSTR_LSTR000989 [Laodelphax striatellus]
MVHIDGHKLLGHSPENLGGGLFFGVSKMAADAPANQFTRENKWLCTNCGNLYKSKPSLKFHQKVHCGKNPKYACQYCDRKFFQSSNYKTHVMSQHRDCIAGTLLAADGSLVGERNANHLAYSPSASTIDLLEHSDNHCGICSKYFKSKYNIKKHIKHVHMKVSHDIFECPVCRKSIARKDNWKKHLLVVHKLKI